ncbi:MAG: nodulation protein NfeD [Oceanospirillaceae bacterium]|nr:nodulation protein NfeD [Oceanospirillaceae bacterium]
MRFNKFDMNLLVVLDALLTERNITRAGEKLFLSQSATSGALARLREYFDDQLLVQVGRKMVLTPLAESLVKPVRSLLIQARATLETRPDLDPAQSTRKITIIMSDYTSMVVMPEVTRRASKQAPGISFEILSPGDDPMTELDQGNVDFLLMPGTFLSDRHPKATLFTEQFVCICDNDNALVGDTIAGGEYEALGHIAVGFGSHGRPGIDSVLTERAGIDRRVDVTVNAYSLVPQYVLGTERIATVHKRLAEFWAQFLPIRAVQPLFELPSIPWCLQWHQYRDMDPITLWVRDLMMEVMTPATD